MSSPATNKVKFGLSKCYYAVYTESTDTYVTPVALPGAVSLTIDPEGETTKFRADNVDYYTTVANNGYSGSLELAKFPASFFTDVLGELADSTSGMRYEKSDIQPKPFALLFQVEGDVAATRFAFYNVTAARPGAGSQTTDTTITPVTETINITAAARASDHVVKGVIESGATSYSNWFSAVVTPTIATT